MITFDRLWITMQERGISQYKLIKDYKISTGQLDRLRKNENVNTYTLSQLCKILDCRLEDIAEYKNDLPQT
jgi:putative transcriptional regulator